MLSELLARTGIPADDAVKSEATCPGKIFFLQREFLETYWSLAALPPEQFEPTAAFAAELDKMPVLRLLAWHLYRYTLVCPINEYRFQDFPEPLEDLGDRTGLFYLLIAMSQLPSYRERAEREGFPVRYADAAAERLGTSVCFHEQVYGGKFGWRPAQLIFMIHYRENATFRIGRFDFVLEKSNGRLPEVYRKDGKLVAFCLDNWQISADDVIASENAPAVRTVRLKKDGTVICGTPIDHFSGKVEKTELTIDLADGWEAICTPEDWTVFFHIPGGGGMTPEKCEASFGEAVAFFREYCPQKELRVIWSSSWIFNPAWRDYLPGSNMSKLIDRGKLLFPVKYKGHPAEYFVFGKEGGAPDDYEANNSMERAMLQCWRERGAVRSCGIFMLAEDFC